MKTARVRLANASLGCCFCGRVVHPRLPALEVAKSRDPARSVIATVDVQAGIGSCRAFLDLVLRPKGLVVSVPRSLDYLNGYCGKRWDDCVPG